MKNRQAIERIDAVMSKLGITAAEAIAILINSSPKAEQANTHGADQTNK